MRAEEAGAAGDEEAFSQGVGHGVVGSLWVRGGAEGRDVWLAAHGSPTPRCVAVRIASREHVIPDLTRGPWGDGRDPALSLHLKAEHGPYTGGQILS